MPCATLDLKGESVHVHRPHSYRLSLKVLSWLILPCVLFTGLAGAQESDPTSFSSLINQLKDPDSAKRHEAAWRIEWFYWMRRKEVVPEEIVPHLVQALKDPDARVRSSAAQALGSIGVEATEAVPHLIEALEDPDLYVHSSAAKALGKIGEGRDETEAVVTLLIGALKDHSAHARESAAEALGDIGEGATQAVPHLIQALKDPESSVFASAIAALGKIGRRATQAVVPQLIEALKNPDENIRHGAASALGYIGEGAKEAVPQLTEALRDSDAFVRSGAAEGLGGIGKAAEEAVPQLSQALKDPDINVRDSAATALGKIGGGATQAVPQLARTLIDPNKQVRASAAVAIGQIGEGAMMAVPHLVQALKDPDANVRISAAKSLSQLSTIIARQRATEFGNHLNTAADIMRNSPDPEVKQYADGVQQAGDLLQLLWWEQLKRWAGTRPSISVAIVAYALLMLIWLLLLWLRPLWLLRINDTLAGTTDIKLPGQLGGFNVAPRHLIMVGFFHYRPRVLDAWVAKYIGSARAMFPKLPTVEERKIYVPLPVILGEESEAELSPDKLRAAFSRSLVCLQIGGEGGAGKTSLACRLAWWAMSPQRDSRLNAEHIMLPVLIEQDLATHDKDIEHPLFRAIKQQVRMMIDEDDPPPAGLLHQLLKKRRVLVIIDGLSEMNAASRAATLAGITDLSVNAVVITTRSDEQLVAIPKTEIKPLRVKGNRLSTFMEVYLTARKKRDLFEDEEFFEACRRLSSIVEDRDITALLAKLYAEQMITVKEGAADANAPSNIPELMLSYLNDLSRRAGPGSPDIRVVHRAAKSVAWECLKKTLKPAPAPRAGVLSALCREGDGEALLVYLEDRLKVIQTVRAGRDQIRFAVDPLAEYLAGMHLVDEYGEDEQAWRRFLGFVNEQGGAPKDIKGFLLAVRDCCFAQGEDTPVPEFVGEELMRLVGESAKEVKLVELIRLLKSPHHAIRLDSVKAIGDLGEAAEQAIPALIKTLDDRNEGVRNAAIRALTAVGSLAVPALIGVVDDKELAALTRLGSLRVIKNLGPKAGAAVPKLVKALGDSDDSIHQNLINAVGSIGPKASAAVPALIKLLEETDDNFTRSDVAYALEKVVSTPAVFKEFFPSLIDSLRRSNASVRKRIIDILGKFASEGKEISPVLVDFLDDADADVRSMATTTLISFSPDSIPDLIRALRDEKVDVRNRAATALAEIGSAGKEAVPSLINLLQDDEEDRAVRLNATRAIGKIGSEAKAAIPLLTSLKDHQDEVFRQAALRALSRIGN